MKKIILINIIFLNLQDALSIFDKQINDQNIEIYLDDPLKANSFKNKIEKLPVVTNKNKLVGLITFSDITKLKLTPIANKDKDETTFDFDDCEF